MVGGHFRSLHIASVKQKGKAYLVVGHGVYLRHVEGVAVS